MCISPSSVTPVPQAANLSTSVQAVEHVDESIVHPSGLGEQAGGSAAERGGKGGEGVGGKVKAALAGKVSLDVAQEDTEREVE
eukprot:CAMPEP_0197545254 /NCGR_PEP_ID=MMETSP1320-20131121/377_1 /TAXON_ID=91990 /ORGANISM="Bolidomonas sp., Strain RCC2347" /LENGTH=82 /DNA_ID=CAMNT_0043104745 /DNA_START=806 /DNA_END=1053 /DNA_ORIENTATION=-